ncbi:MAG: hypothetical protein ACJ71Z_00630 [Aeromicrobium sp.]
MTWLVALFGIGFTAFGGWAAIDPASFPAAEFPPYNQHFIHDVAATFLAFGIGLLASVRTTAWRTPVLALAAVWNALHAVSHVIDVGRASTQAAGVHAVIELVMVTVALVALAWLSWRTDRSSA